MKVVNNFRRILTRINNAIDFGFSCSNRWVIPFIAFKAMAHDLLLIKFRPGF
jgi:hypothetical protein